MPERTAFRAKLVAMAVRNAMEDFHAEHLTDEQMADLNPIIRNAIATALHALDTAETDARSMKYLAFQARLIPSYWEEPTLLSDLIEIRDDTQRADCRRCRQTIVRVTDGEVSGRWLHTDAARLRGCRAASFTADSGWDDSLDRRWYAAPVKCA